MFNGAIYFEGEVEASAVPAAEPTPAVAEPEPIKQPEAEPKPQRVPPQPGLIKKVVELSRSELLTQDERSKLTEVLPTYDEIEALRALGALEKLLSDRFRNRKAKSNGLAA